MNRVFFIPLIALMLSLSYGARALTFKADGSVFVTSVKDKHRVGNGFYLLEAALAVVVAGHAYVIMSMGSIS